MVSTLEQMQIITTILVKFNRTESTVTVALSEEYLIGHAWTPLMRKHQ